MMAGLVGGKEGGRRKCYQLNNVCISNNDGNTFKQAQGAELLQSPPCPCLPSPLCLYIRTDTYQNMLLEGRE